MTLEVESRVVTDRLDENLELDKYSKDYLEAWGTKCSRESYESGTRVRDTVDLDGHGQKFVAAFLESAEECAARGKLLPHDYLGYLILIVRNDIVHQYSHVSRSAYQCLLKYLCSHPYSAVSRDPTAAYGEVVVCPDSAWLPLLRDLNTFFSNYLMYDDMSLSGQQYAQDELGLQPPSKRMGAKMAEKWRHTDEMLLHCVNCALERDEKDFNGDLLMFDYFIKVISQDLDSRLEVIHNILNDKECSGNQGTYFTQMKSLLENSVLWRMFIGIKWNPKVSRNIVLGLVKLIVDCTGVDDEAMEYAEDEPEDDAPAGACAFSSAELSNMASLLLNKLLDMFGAMEGLGGFLATSSYRAATVNYRMALDEYMVESFWMEKGVCKDIRSSSQFLYSLKPRDALRLIGIVTATKFTRACSPEDVKRRYGDDSMESVQELFKVTEVMSTGTKDIETFFEIDVISILHSYTLDVSRAIKIYKTADHLALLVGVIAASLTKLVLTKQAIPVKRNDLEMVKKCVKSCVDAIYHQESATSNASKLSTHGSIFLSVASIFLQIQG